METFDDTAEVPESLAGKLVGSRKNPEIKAQGLNPKLGRAYSPARWFHMLA